MRFLSLLLILILASCASQQKRETASDYPQPPPDLLPDHRYSIVRLFPSDDGLTKRQPLFYLEFKNSSLALVDVPEESLRVENESVLKFEMKRLSRGRFSLIVEGDVQLEKLRFFVYDKILEHQMNVRIEPNRKKSSLELIEQLPYERRFRLILNDGRGIPVEIMQLPEIIHEGDIEIRDLRIIRKGVWEFSMIYPEANQVFYISIRANGVLLERLYRFQHVEK